MQTHFGGTSPSSGTFLQGYKCKSLVKWPVLSVRPSLTVLTQLSGSIPIMKVLED